MQITHTHDDATSHLLGGSVAHTQHFQIDSGLKIFDVLTANLYSDKIKAVVRETLANANDSHQSSNIDFPIKVTITEDKISIRDYGTGIPQEDMLLRYCTLGYSTKENDENQTGGFGLGCKSPFAYTPTFTVITYNGGFKSVYLMEKTPSGPTMNLIVSVPSDETGLEVSFSINSTKDYLSFIRNIKHFVKYSGWKVELNGELIPSLFPIKEHSGFYYINKDALPFSTTVYIRLGGILYPLNTSQVDVRSLLQISSYALVIEGIPDKIVPAPSREELSYTPTTINTINGLIEKIKKVFDKRNNQTIHQYKIEKIKRIINDNFDLVDEMLFIPSNAYSSAKYREIINSSKSQEIIYKISDIADVMTPIIDSLRTDLFLKYILKERYSRAKQTKKQTHWLYHKYLSSLVKGKVPINELLTKKLTRNEIDVSNLYWLDLEENGKYSRIMSLEEADKYCSYLYNRVMHSDTLLIAPNKSGLNKHYPYQAYQKTKLVYFVGNDNKLKDKVINLFTSLGVHIEDWTAEYKSILASQRTTPKVKSVKKEGLPLLKDLNLKDPYNYLSEDLPYSTDFNMVLFRKYYSSNKDYKGQRMGSRLFSEYRDDSLEFKYLQELFGSKIGIVKSNSQLQSLLDKGYIEANEGIRKAIETYLDTNPLIKERILKYEAYFKWKGNAGYSLSRISNSVVPLLNELNISFPSFTLPPSLNTNENKYRSLLNTSYFQDTYDAEIYSYVSSYKPLGEFLHKTSLSLIDWDTCWINFRNNTYIPEITAIVNAVLPKGP